MPQVDFTLEDVRKVMREDMREMMGEMMDRHFIEEREYTRAMIRESRDEIIAQFSSFVADNFTPAIESLQEQIHEVRRDMKRLRIVAD